MATEEAERALIERVLARPVAAATQAVWGFTNRTDIVTLASGDRVVVQRYRRRQDAACSSCSPASTASPPTSGTSSPTACAPCCAEHPGYQQGPVPSAA
jgi:hypothetical protein